MRKRSAVSWWPQNGSFGSAVLYFASSFFCGVGLVLTIFMFADSARNSQGINAADSAYSQLAPQGRATIQGDVNQSKVDLGVISGGLSGQSHPFKRDRQKKLILMYNGFYSEDRHLAFDSFEFQNCKVTACQKTFDKGLLDFADAVILHDRGSQNEDYPPRKSADGIWVWLQVEPCKDWRGPDRAGSTVFNWTLTYARYSEARIPYGAYYKRPAHPAKPVPYWERRHSRIFQRKTKMAAWLVGHCETGSQREVYIMELKKYVDVDVYGGCDALGNIGGIDWDDAIQMIRQDYKFYLSFENSLCRDYITEKFWKHALLNEAVPVVRGGFSHEDYLSAAPPNSFIDTRNFTSPKALAEYLIEVASSEELYKSYFKWEYDYALLFDDEEKYDASKEQEQNGLCNLCEALHSHIPVTAIDPYYIHSSLQNCYEVPHADLLWDDTGSPATLA